MRRLLTIAMVGALALAVAACGGLNDDGAGGGSGTTGETGGGGSTGGEPIEHPTGADEVVLRWEYRDGFVPYEYLLKRLPSWTLYGDGRVVVEGPMIEIYPSPALPNVQVRQLSEDGVRAILRAAEDAGLMAGDASYDYRCITDAPTTVFTTDAGGSTSVVSAYALGDAAGGTCPDVDVEARRTLMEFRDRLGDLSWLPDGSVGEEEPYVAEEVRIYVLPYLGQPDLPQEPVAWPLGKPLHRFGEPLQSGLEDTRCGVVSGSDLETLLPLMQGANDLTPWTSEGREYRLIARPLLPDEHGC
ncbi:MAG TPA: hypothetical protein VFR44_10980 [Actinomycetota bacterium]|nr:hypothetical protein [Actinomycetota bacterium]